MFEFTTPEVESSHVGIDVTVAEKRIDRLQDRMLDGAGLILARNMAIAAPVGVSGHLRGSISSARGMDRSTVFAGILSPVKYDDSSANEATIGAYLQFGFRRHFVSFFNPDGLVRWNLVHWATRVAGMKVFASEKTGRAVKVKPTGWQSFSASQGFARKGIMVGPHQNPWATNGLEMAKGELEGFFASFANAL